MRIWIYSGKLRVCVLIACHFYLLSDGHVSIAHFGLPDFMPRERIHLGVGESISYKVSRGRRGSGRCICI